MRFSIFPGLPTSSSANHPILACGSAYSKIYFWDLTRLEQYYDYKISLPSTIQNSSTTTRTPQSNPVTLTDLNINQVLTDVSTAHSTQSTPQPKRPSFLYPSRTRAPRNGSNKDINSNHALSRLRDISPSSSTTSNTHSTSASTSITTNSHNHRPVSESNPTAQSTSIPPSTAAPTTSQDLLAWGKKYLLGRALQRLQPHKVEIIRGLNFLGRQVSWSVGGEWCVVAGSMRCIGVFGRWDKMVLKEWVGERGKVVDRGRSGRDNDEDWEEE